MPAYLSDVPRSKTKRRWCPGTRRIAALLRASTWRSYLKRVTPVCLFLYLEPASWGQIWKANVLSGRSENSFEVVHSARGVPTFNHDSFRTGDELRQCYVAKE